MPTHSSQELIFGVVQAVWAYPSRCC